jgi:hypothetical protein
MATKKVLSNTTIDRPAVYKVDEDLVLSAKDGKFQIWNWGNNVTYTSPHALNAEDVDSGTFVPIGYNRNTSYKVQNILYNAVDPLWHEKVVIRCYSMGDGSRKQLGSAYNEELVGLMQYQ